MGESDELTFEGAIGQQMFLNKLIPTNATGVSWQLTSPTGANVVSLRAYNDVNTFTLTESGTYTLLLHGTGDEIDYSLQVVDVPPTETTPIEFNTTYNGAISVPGETDEYTFNGVAGQKLYFRDPTGVTVKAWLNGPSGAVFTTTAGSWEGVLPATGLYTLTIDVDTDAVPTYDFAFYEQPSVPAVPIAFGDTINGNISIPGERDRYSFTATAGQTMPQSARYCSTECRSSVAALPRSECLDSPKRRS